MLNYKNVFSNNNSFSFDEHGAGKGINYMLMLLGYKVYIRPINYADIRVETYGLRTTREIYSSNEIIKYELSKQHIFYLFNKGSLIQYSLINNKIVIQEELYIHLQKRKMKNHTSNNNRFFITPNKFVDYKQITKRTLLKIKEKESYYAYLVRKILSIVKKLKHILKRVIK